MDRAIARIEACYAIASNPDEKTVEMDSGVGFARLRIWAARWKDDPVEITLSDVKPNVMGSVTIPSRTVRISGIPEAVDGAFCDFYYRFMSAGA